MSPARPPLCTTFAAGDRARGDERRGADERREEGSARRPHEGKPRGTSRAAEAASRSSRAGTRAAHQLTISVASAPRDTSTDGRSSKATTNPSSTRRRTRSRRGSSRSRRGRRARRTASPSRADRAPARRTSRDEGRRCERHDEELGQPARGWGRLCCPRAGAAQHALGLTVTLDKYAAPRVRVGRSK
jgi:transcription factor SPN1